MASELFSFLADKQTCKKVELAYLLTSLGVVATPVAMISSKARFILGTPSSSELAAKEGN